MIILDDTLINRTIFDEKTNQVYAHDELQGFICPSCKVIFIACEACHVYFINSADITKTKSFHPLDKPNCPNCKQNWDGNSLNQVNPTIEDIKKSSWSWLIE